MGLSCLLGHAWAGCKCSKCGKTRDEGHDWGKDCEKCSKCGKTRDIYTKDSNGSTLLHHAAANGHKDVAELLLAKGADVNAKTKFSQYYPVETPLHRAAFEGHKDVAELLLAKGADVNAKTENRHTPLHFAAVRGYMDVAELLLAHGAEVDATTDEGETPLDRAAGKGYKGVVELLLAHRAVVSAEQKPAPPIQSASKYWKCPKCGAVHDKGLGSLLAGLGATIFGAVTCANCGSQYTQGEVSQGKFDADEPTQGHRLRLVDSTYKFFVGDSMVAWGSEYNMGFNEQYTALELSWMLDGTLFPVSSSLTEAECRKLVEENFPAAFQIALRSSKLFGLPDPEESDGYALTITKLQLSYAVRNNVSFPEAVRVFKSVMG